MIVDTNVTAVSHYGSAALRPVAGISPEEALLSRMIGRGCHSPLAGFGDGAMLSLYPAQISGSDWQSPATLIYGSGTLEIAQGARLVRALCGIDIGAEFEADEERWRWLEAAIIGRLGDTPFAGAEGLALGAGPESAHAIALRIMISTPGHAFSHYARANADTWLQLVEGSLWARDKLDNSAWLNLMLNAGVGVARHTMPQGVVSTLAAGDIIVPNAPRFNCDGEGMLRLGDLQTRVLYRGAGMLEIIAVEGKMEFEGSEQDEFPPIEGEGAMRAEQMSDQFGVDVSAADAVPITLDFLLGRVRMALGDVRALGPGVVIAFDGSASAIDIVCNGRRLGQGEVVEVGGELGIRIIQWGAEQ